MTDTNDIVRSTIIWSLEETIKKQDEEIERLREQVSSLTAEVRFWENATLNKGM